MLTIAEQYSAVLHIISGNQGKAAPGSVRSMLESYVDFTNLLQDRDYLQVMQYASAEQDRRLFAEVLSTGIEDGKELWGTTVAEWLHDATSAVERHQKAGVRTMNTFERFKLAGIGHEYVGFRMLCKYVHPNTMALVANHATAGSELRYKDPLPTQATFGFLVMAAGLVAKAMRRLHEFSNVKREDVDTLVERLDAQFAASDPDNSGTKATNDQGAITGGDTRGDTH